MKNLTATITATVTNTETGAAETGVSYELTDSLFDAMFPEIDDEPQPASTEEKAGNDMENVFAVGNEVRAVGFGSWRGNTRTTADYAGEIIRETEKAILIECFTYESGYFEIWLPKSQLKVDAEMTADSEDIWFKISYWLMENGTFTVRDTNNKKR